MKGRSGQVSLDRHVIFFEKVVRDVMIGVTFEIGFIGLVRLQIDLRILKHFEWFFEATWDLFADNVEGIGGEIEFL